MPYSHTSADEALTSVHVSQVWGICAEGRTMAHSRKKGTIRLFVGLFLAFNVAGELGYGPLHSLKYGWDHYAHARINRAFATLDSSW